jgi:hypothetical protein
VVAPNAPDAREGNEVGLPWEISDVPTRWCLPSYLSTRNHNSSTYQQT